MPVTRATSSERPVGSLASPTRGGTQRLRPVRSAVPDVCRAAGVQRSSSAAPANSRPASDHVLRRIENTGTPQARPRRGDHEARLHVRTSPDGEKRITERVVDGTYLIENVQPARTTLRPAGRRAWRRSTNVVAAPRADERVETPTCERPSTDARRARFLRARPLARSSSTIAVVGDGLRPTAICSRTTAPFHPPPTRHRYIVMNRTNPTSSPRRPQRTASSPHQSSATSPPTIHASRYPPTTPDPTLDPRTRPRSLHTTTPSPNEPNYSTLHHLATRPAPLSPHVS